MAEIITPHTNLYLIQTAEWYDQKVRVPQYSAVGSFAAAYARIGMAEAPQTLITGDEESLAVSVDTAHSGSFFVNIDLSPDSLAAIVRPGFYDLSGRPDTEGTWARPTVRPLTEPEGCGLISDLASMAVGLS